jgi:hypothetical protein
MHPWFIHWPQQIGNNASRLQYSSRIFVYTCRSTKALAERGPWLRNFIRRRVSGPRDAEDIPWGSRKEKRT